MDFGDYAEASPRIALRREDGVLEVRLHDGDGPYVWTEATHGELINLFRAISSDDENRVVILTGTGSSFIDEFRLAKVMTSASGWDHVMRDARTLLNALLDVNVPMISAINGPVSVHPELPLLSDIVLASESATFQDGIHFLNGLVPSDGSHTLWAQLIGPTRSRYFLLTGQQLTADQALDYGIVNEVLPDDRLVDRAWELGRSFATKTPMTLRYTRACITMPLRQSLGDSLDLGLALEGLAILDMRSGRG